MRIEQFDPAADPDRLRACHELFIAGGPADDPNRPPMSLPHFTGWWVCGWTGEPREVWLGTDLGGTPVGCYLLELPDRDNTGLAQVLPVVAPARRRMGVGTALLRHAAGRAADAGRELLSGETIADTPGALFALAHGARLGLTEIRSRLDMAAMPGGCLPLLRKQAEGRAAGYSLLCWKGRVPAEYLGQVAAVNSAMADAPHVAGQEAARWDGARVRAADRRIAMQGLRFYSVAARCTATGELVALTQLGVDPELPAWAFQELTAVTRAHRGHRLGLLVKVVMLQWLADREPQLQRVLTYNSAANKHMIAINTELGYRALDRLACWELGIPAAAGQEPVSRRTRGAAAASDPAASPWQS
jgi:GNAT superfamily N-acetyltransferase